jgi:hypothetical protein
MAALSCGERLTWDGIQAIAASGADFATGRQLSRVFVSFIFAEFADGRIKTLVRSITSTEHPLTFP